ncbi:MAG: carbohydrate kinase [Actinobacteria bacterium]|nr:carbohydrate kinase [Actinomycetota bacterium]
MTAGCVLAIDQGTSSTKAIVVDETMTILAEAGAPVHPQYGADGHVEVDPEDLWRSVLDAGRAAVAKAPRPVDGIALANQGETVLAWDRNTGQSLSPALVWQDRRAEGVCTRLRESADLVTDISGLQLDPYFSAPKMTWLRENGHADGVVTTSDTWLLHRLTGEFVTDVATAGRAALLDLDTLEWSPQLTDLFGLDVGLLPRVVACDEHVGTTRAFGRDIPVAGTVVDQQGALFAEACHRAGEAKCTYGTGAFLLANTGARPVRSTAGLVACPAWKTTASTAYCLDGQVYTVGSVVDWLEAIGVIAGPKDLDRYAADATPGREVFIPALAGLAAPFWAPGARGALLGLGLSTDRSQIVGAVLEGLAAAVAVLCHAVDVDLASPLSALRVDGGLTRSVALMQRQADLLQRPVEVYATPDATALGAAAFARLGLGWADNAADAIAGAAERKTVYEPQCSSEEAAERVARWRSAVDLTIESASHE